MPDRHTTRANVTHPTTYDWDSDRKRIALAKAIEPEDRGQVYFLNHATRLHLVRSRNTRVARLLEALYFTGYDYGWISIKEAEEIIRPLYRNAPTSLSKQIRKSLDALAALIDNASIELRAAKGGDLFPISANYFNSGEFREKIPAKSHKKGRGSGLKRGRPHREYWIPRAAAVNELFGSNDDTLVAFPVRALESDVAYRSFVWKVRVIVAGHRVSIKQTEMAEELNISRSTQRVYAAMSGTRSHAYHTKYKLSTRQISEMPADRRGQRKSDQPFTWVHDENGRWARANKEDIQKRSLEGHLYAVVRTATVYQDETFESWIVEGW